MSSSDLSSPLLGEVFKLIGLAAPLSHLAVVTVMVVQAYNEMANLGIGAGAESAPAKAKIESGESPWTTLLDQRSGWEPVRSITRLP